MFVIPELSSSRALRMNDARYRSHGIEEEGAGGACATGDASGEGGRGSPRFVGGGADALRGIGLADGYRDDRMAGMPHWMKRASPWTRAPYHKHGGLFGAQASRGPADYFISWMLPGGGSLRSAQKTPTCLTAFTNSWKPTGLTT